MQSFEHICKVALEADGFVVTSNIKFPVQRKTKKTNRDESQIHGYEIDLLGARADQLILAEVKSYLGSRGVQRQGFIGLADESKKTHFDRYKLINDSSLRDDVVRLACERFGYTSDKVTLRLYVGKFASGHADSIRNHLGTKNIEVISLDEIVTSIFRLASSSTYIDDPVVMTVKAIDAAKRLAVPLTATKSNRPSEVF